jgi:hypothetical protein
MTIGRTWNVTRFQKQRARPPFPFRAVFPY